MSRSPIRSSIGEARGRVALLWRLWRRNWWISWPRARPWASQPFAEDRHVLATAVAAGAQVVVTANIAHFRSPRFVDSDRTGLRCSVFGHQPANQELAA